MVPLSVDINDVTAGACGVRAYGERRERER